jgi:hypothetical protein
MIFTVIALLLATTCAVSAVGIAKEVSRRRYSRQFNERIQMAIFGQMPQA